jgi:NAD(P)-dependent dehydrogenase (short-subunit alcohol dehydrogenase family)
MARVLITGCSTGIGRATAVELAARGHEVVATARRPETLEGIDVAERHGLDVDDDVSVQAAVAAAGAVDVLVNNAGWETAGPVEKADLDEVRAMFETNLLGAARMIQAVLPAMRERGSGTIVNVSSVAGVVAGPLNGFYSASKHALEALSESLHYEVGHFGIRVVIIEPGAFATAFGDNARRHGEDSPPYDELRRQWDTAADVLTGGAAPSPEPVARAIADAIEADGPPLRVPVGDDAQLVVAVRAANDDATFEATMRETLGLTW